MKDDVAQSAPAGQCGEPYHPEPCALDDADPFDEGGQERAAIARMPGPAVEPSCKACYDKGVVDSVAGATSCPHCTQGTSVDHGRQGDGLAGAPAGMSSTVGLIAFRFAESVVVAAHTPEQALAVLHGNAMYQDFVVAHARRCAETELDAAQTCTSGRPAPTLRQRLLNVSEPCWLQDWDGSCPPMPASIWVELESLADGTEP